MSELKDFGRMFRLDGKVALVTGGEICRGKSIKHMLMTWNRLKRARATYSDCFPACRRKESLHLCAEERGRAGRRPDC